MTFRFASNQKQGLCLLSFLFLVYFGCHSTLSAQPLEEFEIPSSFNPVGSGARALGMGGAFIAVADDATAASWNPAGLIQLDKPEVSIVGAGFVRDEDLDFGTGSEANGSNSVSKARINYLSASYPFALGRFNMVISANYQNLFDFTRDWDFKFKHSVNGSTNIEDIDIDQNGTLSAWGLAYCIKILPQLSFGVTLNFWEDGIYKNKWKNTSVEKASITEPNGEKFTSKEKTVEEFFFSGFNANLGILWNVTSKLNVGAVFKTPFTADIKKQKSFSRIEIYPDDLEDPIGNITSPPRSTEHLDLDMPRSYGIGLAYRFSDNLTASLDLYRTEWEDFELEDSDGKKTSPICGECDVDPTYQVRMGAEYVFTQPQKYVIPLRGGLFYDPAPAEGSPDDYYGFSLGSGITRERFSFDIAYQYRFGNNVGEYFWPSRDLSQDVKEHTVFSSLIIYF